MFMQCYFFSPLAHLEGSVRCPAETPSHSNLYDFKSKTKKHVHTVIFIIRLQMKTTQSNWPLQDLSPPDEFLKN